MCRDKNLFHIVLFLSFLGLSLTQGDSPATPTTNKTIDFYHSAESPQNYALQFDGINDYLEIPEIAAIRTHQDEPLTIEFWVWIPSYPKNWQKVLSKWGAGGGQDDEFVFSLHSDGTFGFANTGSTGLDSKITIPTEQWCHLCCVWDSANKNYALYSNGEQTFCTIKGGRPLQLTGENLRIGTDGHRNQYFKGKIDEIRIWKKALTQAQVEFYMDKKIIRGESAIVGYWDFDEGRGQVVNDDSATRNRGRLGSSPFADKSDPQWIPSNLELELYPQ